MSTRSRINYLQENGHYRSIYCHFDGYPSGVGAILYHSYTTLDEVKALVDMGDMSQLSDTIESSTFYMRDRGEEGVDASVSAVPTTEAYSYVFEDYIWYVKGASWDDYIILESLINPDGSFCDDPDELEEDEDEEEEDEDDHPTKPTILQETHDAIIKSLKQTHESTLNVLKDRISRSEQASFDMIRKKDEEIRYLNTHAKRAWWLVGQLSMTQLQEILPGMVPWESLNDAIDKVMLDEKK